MPEWRSNASRRSDGEGSRARIIAIPLGFRSRSLAAALYVGIALMWLLPDHRIERVLEEEESGGR
ncbi:MAG: hypothetical protein ABIT20_17580 [Gemmatimonadaceae bacterium]